MSYRRAMAIGERVRWGICGTGRIAADFVRGLQLVDDADVVAVASRTAERAGEFASEFGIERRHTGTESLAEDEEVDVVYVASTQDRHVADTVTLLEGGRPVLCEKPFALSLADAERMIDTARRHELFLMEALWSRFLPSYVRLRELLDEGAIGEPLLVEANFSFRVPDDNVAGHRLFDPHRGGGSLLDLGVYPVQLAHFVLGPPDTISSSASVNADGIDEQTAMLLGYDTGAAALLHTAIRTHGTNAARIAGTDGVIEIAPFMHAANAMTLRRGDSEELLEFPRASLHFQVPEVHRCLRDGLTESSVMPHRETLAIMTTLDTVLRQIGVSYPSTSGEVS